MWWWKFYGSKFKILIHPSSLRSLLFSHFEFQKLVSKLASLKESLCNLEERAWNGSLQARKNYWELGDWNTSHITSIE